jgi:ADP-heptose:LPS heptosyltransferase
MGWGDEMMAAGEAQAASETQPVAILGGSGEHRWHAAWENNPCIARPGQQFSKQIVNGPGHRPYVAEFKNNRWFWKRYAPKPAQFFFSPEELALEAPNDIIALEPHCKQKAEAVNRDWRWSNWVRLAEMLRNERLVQFGPAGTRILPNVEFIETPTPRHMAARMRNAKAFVSTEGGFHHTAAALRIQGVVIFGGFISPQVTGYEFHKSLFVGDGLGCGRRERCLHCEDALKQITPEIVVAELNKILEN